MGNCKTEEGVPFILRANVTRGTCMSLYAGVEDIVTIRHMNVV